MTTKKSDKEEYRHLQTWLEEAGLSSERAKVYMVLLGLGRATALELANKLGQKRTTVYDQLRGLVLKGFCTEQRRGRQTIFTPLHPKELHSKVQRHGARLKELMPDFLAVLATDSSRPPAQIFEGEMAAKAVFEDILLHAKKEYIYFSPPRETIRMVDESWMKKWVERRVKKGIKARALRVQGQSDIKNYDPAFDQEKPFLREIRFLPAYVDLKSALYVYGDTVALISTKKEQTAAIIHSSDLAYSLKQLFTFLWSISR